MLKKFKMLLMMLFVCLFSVGIVNADLLSPGKSYTLTPSPNTGYTDPTLSKLTNSNLAWGDSVRWSGINPVIVLDLGASYTLQSVSMYAMYSDGEGIFPPTSVEIQLSEDGINFTSVGSITSFTPYGSYSRKGTSNFADTLARYVRYSPIAGSPYIIEIEAEGLTPPPTPTPTLPPASPTPPPATPLPTAAPQNGSITASFGGVVYGRILDKFRNALPDIKVTYSTSGSEYLGSNPVLTDNDGYYYFEDVDTQYNYGLEMTAKRYGTITINKSGGVQDAVIRIPDEIIIRGLSDKFNLTGTVTDLYNAPVNHARVRVKSAGEPKITYTDSLGGFSVPDLFIGTYTVSVKHSGYFVGRVKFSNSNGLDSEVSVLMTEK
mgnify:FL=1